MKVPLHIPWSTCRCGAALFFPNTQCLGCGAAVGFDPEAGRVVPVEPVESAGPGAAGELVRLAGGDVPACFRLCRHRTDGLACNWLIPAEDPADTAFCEACRLTRTSPEPNQPGAEEKWSNAELAKRRVLAGLWRLGLRIPPLTATPGGLAFDLLLPTPDGPPVMTGHANGVITLNLDEADPATREHVRQQMAERYRTLEGHFRHEIAHYLWQRLVDTDPEWRGQFDSVFGDSSADYAAALAHYHAEGPPLDWQARYISAYASSHPWEDWAETTAHYLHASEGLQTARSLGLNPASVRLDVESFPPEVLGAEAAGHREVRTFLRTIDDWVRLGLMVNELNRALGQQDAYPFVFSGEVVRKLWCVHRSLKQLAVA